MKRLVFSAATLAILFGITNAPSSKAQNVSTHALVVCTPSAGMYWNPTSDEQQKIRQLPYGNKIGFRYRYNTEWDVIEDYGTQYDRWGFMRHACVGSYNSW